MADVVLRSALPSVRLGLIAMLSERHHRPIAEDQAGEDAVWVLDDPDPDLLDRLSADLGADVPRAAVILTDDAGQAARLARAGRPGWACLGRDAGVEELDLAVRAAAAGLVLLDLPALAAAVGGLSGTTPAQSAPNGDRPPEHLTPREFQVLQLIAQGLPNKGIARALGISENTAKFHVAALTAKLGASSRTEAVTIGARRGLIVL